jgi:hypothetical protein
MREYNARLPRDAVKVQIFGLDVPGSPGNRDAARGPDTALRSAVEYLRWVTLQQRRTCSPGSRRSSLC